MNDHNRGVQQTLFERASLHWSSMQLEAQQRIVEVLSQMLQDAADRQRASITTSINATEENRHVS